ncbi:Holo-[acyl-carrier-protein] synthase [Candidatus Providencia siddallii]|uniref:Holo-[acyl-carrier-protein] synthase n=1 Tax=Candidatus Providencia siddallii TaxID=1715285 RepID=A0A0M6W8Q6_9GAMM|nr:Holo-[acyl-carrier-protein] synthase [Candidatus Providencia siddallii]
MTILGLGVDLVEISRIESVIKKSQNSLAKRILTNTEFLQYQKQLKPARFLAKKFAAKEAASKALGTGIRNIISLNQFEITNNKMGKPLLKLNGEALKLANSLKVNKLYISITDERNYALAIVIIENLP